MRGRELDGKTERSRKGERSEEGKSPDELSEGISTVLLTEP